MTDDISFGQQLRQHRKARDLTQVELAKRVGCALVTIQKYEEDKRRPSQHVAERLADVLELGSEERMAFVRAARTKRHSTSTFRTITGGDADPAMSPHETSHGTQWIKQWLRHRRRSWRAGLLFIFLLTVSGATYHWHQRARCDISTEYDHVMKRQPDNASVYYKRGLVYDEKGYYDCALADFDRAIAHQPVPDGWFHYARGRTYYRKSEFDRAIDDLNKAIQYLPDYDWAYYFRGLAYTGKGVKERAIADFEKVLEVSKNSDLRDRTQRRLSDVREQSQDTVEE